MTESKKNDPREEMLDDKKTKAVFYFIDPKLKIKIKSKEVYKNGKQFVHFPFNKSNGLPKYDNCKKIVYKDMSEDLPRGFFKNWYKGYGFTKVYSPLIYSILRKGGIKQIIIQKNVRIRIEGNKLFLDPLKLDQLYPDVDSLLSKQKDEKNRLIEKLLPELLPDNFERKETKYIKNTLSNFIKTNINNSSELTDQDVDSLFGLASKVSEVIPLYKNKNILKTKETIEEHYVEQVIVEFEGLLKLKSDTEGLEKKWQRYFKKYSWIFSQLFSFPVLIFSDEAYVGGKNLENKGGKFADFIYKNNLTNNIAFIETKTHNTDLLEKRAYRGTDVFSMSKSLSGALNQVLDQRENLEKEFFQKRTTSNEIFESHNPRCLIIIGNISSLDINQRKSFELLRSNSRDVDIITFDEVLEKVKGLASIMQGSKK